MSNPSHWTRRTFSLLLAILLVVSAVVPSWALSKAPEEDVTLTQSANETVQVEPSVKIADDVQTLMTEEDFVEVLVYMADKFDSAGFKQAAYQDYATKMNPYDMRLAVRRELVVSLKDHASSTQRGVLSLLENNADAVAEYEGFYIANVVYVKAKPAVIEQIARLPEVASIEKNKTIQREEPIDEQAVTPSAEDELLWHLQMVRADQVWGLGIDGTGVVVANIDSGVDWTHPALQTSWRGYDPDGEHDSSASWYDAVANQPFPVDSDSHGTHVMGTIVGRDPETGFTTGVAPGAKWIAARVFNEQGSTTDAALLSSAQWMLAPGGNSDNAPDVVNNSWGGGNMMDPWYIESIDNWIAAEIFPAFAAGNQRLGEPIPGPGSISNPSHYPQAYAVGAVDNQMLRPAWSKRGPSPYTEAGWKPNISAPGVNVISTLPGGSYGANSGTSMATPHVAGVVALMRGADASVTIEDMFDIFSRTAYPLTDSLPTAQESPNYDYGYGLIDAMESVLQIAGGTGTFRGKVLQGGSDAGLPTIEHTQTVTDIYQGSSINVEATIRDDISVVEARLMVQPGVGSQWIEIPMRQQDGDHTGGVYQGVIKPEHMQGEAIQYRIEAVDYADNVAKTPNYTVNIAFGVKPGEAKEGFEGDAPGWSMDPVWSIGAPVRDDEPRPIEGEQYVATALGGMYPAATNAFLISAPIDMRDTAEASVRFFHWFNFGTGAFNEDFGTLYLTNDYGATLNEVATYAGISDGWQGVVADLSDYANSAEPVFAIFHLSTDAYTNALGWYIDDFSVEGLDEEAPAAPAGLVAASTLRGIDLTWNRSPEADVKEYQIFRSVTEGELGEMIGTATTNAYVDPNSNLEEDIMYYYQVKAIDLFGNLSEASNEVSAKKGLVNVINSYDFEDDDGGFTRGANVGEGNDWAWGTPALTPGPGGAYSGTKLWATNLAGTYSSGYQAYLETPAQELPADGTAFLSFNGWYDFEISSFGTKYDYARVLINKTDDNADANWINITPQSDGKYGGNSGGWTNEAISLADYAGETVRIRFDYYADSSFNQAGWYVDDVEFLHVPVTGASIERLTPEPTAFESILGEPVEFQMPATDVEAIETSDISLQDIPIPSARVSVIESGVTVRVDPSTGDYRIRHLASDEGQEWTLMAQAYGFKPEYFKSELKEDHTVDHTFVLQPEDSGSIRGRVYDRYYDEPASGAVVRIIEDPNVAPVIADEDGNFYFEKVYVGDYTLHASADGFESGTAEVTVVADEEAQVDIPLKRFVGVPGEIIYDDGTAENALVLNAAGSGIANRFEPEGYGKLVSASFYFWDNTWPTPGGNEIGFGVFTKDGMTVTQIGETIVRDDIVRGEWYSIDLSELNFSTDQEFYITSIQTKIGTESPGIGIDESQSNEWSYLFAGGDFVTFASQNTNGAAMIRAKLEYGADTPVITNLEAENYVNTDTVLVEGHVNFSDAPVLIYVNDKVAATVEPEDLDEGKFIATVELPQEVNTIKASLMVGEIETEPSPEVIVIKDQIAPELAVVTPTDEERVNVELVHVTGTTSDKYFDRLMVDGVVTEVKEDGTFAAKVIVVEGENVILVEAIDKAGNITTESLKVYVDLGDEVAITDMLPAEDIVVSAGDKVEVAFSAPSGGRATYMITLPFSTQSTDLGIAMTEEPEGRYSAIWTVPTEINFDAVQVFFQYTDAHGNKVTAVAPGTITLAAPVEPTADRLAGDNRYETAAQAAREMYDKAEVVFLAPGLDFPDALSAVPLAHSMQAPLLLSSPKQLPEATLQALKDLDAKQVIILGGEGVISEAVEQELKDLGLTSERIGGKNRYETASLVADRLVDAADHIYLVNGLDFADAISAGPSAATAGDPILLTSALSLSEATKQAIEDLGVTQVTLIGGEGVITPEIVAELEAMDITATRIADKNRYSTNAAVVRQDFAQAKQAVIATGEAFADALCGSLLAAKLDSPLILSRTDTLPEVTGELIKELPLNRVILMGGEGALSQDVLTAIEEILAQ